MLFYIIHLVIQRLLNSTFSKLIKFEVLMLKKISVFFAAVALLLACSSHISAEIIETNEISAIQKHVTTHSLILFNITGTLYEPASTLADNQWRTYFAERVNALISDKLVADRLINKVKNDIVSHLPKKAVEDYTPQLIANLQNQQIPVLGITQKQMATSYADDFGLITRNHLLSIGINLEQTLSYLNVRGDSDDLNHSFAYGLIFTNKKPVGPAILSFLNRLAYQPEKVIMIDNSRDSLENAEAALITSDVKFEGFRYGRADALKMNFDPILGNIQFIAFIKERKIISDEEAIQIKQANPEVNYTALLNKFIIELSILD